MAPAAAVQADPAPQPVQSSAPAEAAPVPAATAAPTPRAGAYRINAGDELEIYVWGEERLQRKVKVLPDGTIAFPLVGKVVAQGYLPSEVEAMITNGLRDQYRGQVPQVTVSVVQPSGMQFSVMGRVRSPGTFTPGRYVNVLEALSMAGGPSEFANLDNVLIIRKSGDDLRTMRVRLAPLFKMGGDSSDIARANILRIETGDTVIVP
ncbi:polysaccharide biosynthesis/export family protein [Sphingopyxis sp. P1IMeth2]|uniref:polysaccharide biosynthesis/export family protein n=1 Tax=Sphingopyxis sp. P1IMeth2 TaxID=1892848 RepID=UPI001644E393|nr:polysaccharide biosynthesis/export family protein [Sphingopyxis sp. P1IMeth2]